MFFKLTHRSSKSNARVGKIFTSRGQIDTPIFMPVGTLGSVKGVFQDDLIDKINAKIILSNNYHLYLRLLEEAKKYKLQFGPQQLLSFLFQNQKQLFAFS